jgi:hypothetical protein
MRIPGRSERAKEVKSSTLALACAMGSGFIAGMTHNIAVKVGSPLLDGLAGLNLVMALYHAIRASQEAFHNDNERKEPTNGKRPPTP